MEGTESKLEFKDIVKKQWILKQLESIGKFVLKKYYKKSYCKYVSTKFW